MSGVVQVQGGKDPVQWGQRVRGGVLGAGPWGGGSLYGEDPMHHW